MEGTNHMTPKRENPWLFAAAKKGKSEAIKQFITKDVNVNYMDNEHLAVDYAWENEFYDVVLLLLQLDSSFPKELNTISQLSEDNENAKNLKNFIQERNLLHKCIERDDLEKVKNIVNKSRSKYYLNVNNVSAVCKALKCKKFKILGYLISIGAEFFNEHEQKEYEQLELKDKLALKEANIMHFSYVSKPHIDYLISKSRTQKPIKKSSDQLKKFYSKLNEIPGVSTIFKVIQYSDYLDIIFDFDKENVAWVNPLSSKNTRGEAMYKEGRLYIAASPERGEKKIMGTIAHELTHMAMQILYDNECNPYMANDLTQKEILEEIRTGLFGNMVHNYPWTILSNIAEEYHEKDYHSELIVTVPQILAECEFGREWLEKNASELMNFYTHTIIPKCHEFINQSPTLKVKNKIRKFNESFGNLIKLRKFDLCFNNVGDSVKNFLSTEDKNIFLLKTEHTYLGLVKVLQALFGRNYINEFDKYLALNFEDLVTELKEAMQVFLNGCDKLILQFNKNVHQEQLIEFFNPVSDLLDISPDKCIIFILHPRVEDKLSQALETLINLPIESKITRNNLLLNSAISLSCFDENFKISSTEITFQGMKIKLSDLIATDERIVNFITGNMIEDLIEGKDICIGKKTAEYYSTEKLFGNIDEKINMETFNYELQNSEDIFVIYGFENRLDLEEKFVAHFDEYNINQDLINRDTIVGHIQIINADSIGVANKRIILTDRFSDEDVKQFCLINCDKKVYFIQFENESFILKQFYSSAFYVERQFKIFVTDRKTLKDLVCLKSTILPWSVDQFRELFIISRTDNDVSLNDFNVYPNVRVLKAKDAETAFNHFYENEAEAKDRWFRLRYDDRELRVHWFHANSKEIHWINSYGSIKSLQSKFRRLDINNKSLIKEKDLVPFLAHKKVVLFAGTPGMGKSTSLSKLYESPLIAKTHWTIRINLEEHLTEIQTINTTNFSTEDFFQLLKNIKPCLNDEITTHILTSILTRESGFKKCLFVFDGFDKILEEEPRRKMIFLLKFIQKITKSKIWIATRLHHKSELEDILSTFALEFDPLNDGNKVHLIDNFFQNYLKLVLKPRPDIQSLGSRIRIYAIKFLEYIEKLFPRRRLAFIETPWQLTLIMMNSTKHFVNWADEPNDYRNDVTYLGKNRSEFSERLDISPDVYTDHFPTVSVLDRIPMPDMNRVINFFNDRYFPPALIFQSFVLLFALSHIAQSWKLFFLLSLYLTYLILDRILAIQKAYIQVVWYTFALFYMIIYLISLSKPAPLWEIPYQDDIHRIYTSSYTYLSDILTLITG